MKIAGRENISAWDGTFKTLCCLSVRCWELVMALGNYQSDYSCR